MRVPIFHLTGHALFAGHPIYSGQKALQPHQPMFQPWRLSPTIEHSANEEPSSLHTRTSTTTTTFAINNTSTTVSTPSHNAVVVDVDEFIISAPAAADRSKYEKLGTNDITSDDDNDDDDNSGAELCHDDVSATTNLTARKLHFKQIVANNLHGKMQAVYGKVDKTQVKVVSPIVRKIRLKADHYSAGKSTNTNREHESKKSTKSKKSSGSNANNATNSNDKDSDNDSIGSASDLQKVEEVASESAHGAVTKMSVSHARRSPKKLADDAMSESVRTCGSSAYHAECESVATNEDNKSRVQIRMRIKKRDRQSDGNDGKEESLVSPLSAEFLHHFGDRPLLLDDELEYDSSDPTTESKAEEHTEAQLAVLTDAEELDVFARAPFRMPEQIERFRHQKRIENPPPPLNPIPFYQSAAHSMDEYISPIKGGLETCISNPFLLPEPSTRAELSTIAQPVFDPPQLESVFNVAPVWNDVPMATVLPEPAVYMVTATEPSIIDRHTPASEQLRTSPHKFINFSQIAVDNTSSDVASSHFGFVHIPDNAFGEISSTGGSDYSVINRASIAATRPSKNKRDKTSSKYTPLKDDKPRASKGNSALVALPAILTSKVKGSTPSYKKVSPIVQSIQPSGTSVASAPTASTAPGTVQHEYQIGFNNMSFEDFPSDQELDPTNRMDGALCKQQSTPFEVVRNEKMLVEAERKFGSLKRRSNLFSS